MRVLHCFIQNEFRFKRCLFDLTVVRCLNAFKKFFLFFLFCFCYHIIRRYAFFELIHMNKRICGANVYVALFLSFVRYSLFCVFCSFYLFARMCICIKIYHMHKSSQYYFINRLTQSIKTKLKFLSRFSLIYVRRNDKQ